MRFSHRVESIETSLARALFNIAKTYDDVIDLTLGDPDLNTPIHIKNAACSAIMENKTHYSANAGLKEARVAISEHLKKESGIVVNPDDELIVTVGGMEALYMALFSIVNPGDEVILLAPYYVNYIHMVKMCDGVPIVVDSFSTSEGMKINIENIEKSITAKTVAIMLNSPNNPTGAIISKEDMAKICDLAVKHDITIISDEVYKSLAYNACDFCSITEFENVKDRMVLVDSLSKEFCMTGWRVGYAYSNPKMIQNMTKVQENIAACAPLPSQYALIEAYTNDTIRVDYISEFKQRRDYLYEAISSIDGLSCFKPQAAFYLFVDISKTNMTSYDFAYGLLEAKHVAVVPGETYGENFGRYIRIAFTKNINVLEEACLRISDFMKKIISNGE